MSMQIPFDVYYRVVAKDGWVEASTVTIYAEKAAMARVKALEMIKARTGERDVFVHAQPKLEGSPYAAARR